jgi:hypothetical protein
MSGVLFYFFVSWSVFLDKLNYKSLEIHIHKMKIIGFEPLSLATLIILTLLEFYSLPLIFFLHYI